MAGGAFWAENPDLPVNPPITYQVWNEQNSQLTYEPRPSAAEYAQLLISAGREVRAADPRAQVTPGGMFGTPQLGRSMTAWEFLADLVRQPGALSYIDAVSIHPYACDLRGIRFQIDKILKELKRANLQRMPLQVTEIGWSSEPRTETSVLFNQGRKGQAQITDKALKLLLRNRKEWNVQRILWYVWRDISRERARSVGCIFCRKMGLFTENLEPKPAYRTFAARVEGTLEGGRGL